MDHIVDNIGIPLSGIDMAYSSSGTIGPQDGDIQVTLKPGHQPTANYVKQLRSALPESFPGSHFAFLPADISSQILNFGAPAPLDVKISGHSAEELQRRLQHVPGIADLRIQQSEGYPSLQVNVDRMRAKGLGITERWPRPSGSTRPTVCPMAWSRRLRNTVSTACRRWKPCR